MFRCVSARSSASVAVNPYTVDDDDARVGCEAVWGSVWAWWLVLLFSILDSSRSTAARSATSSLSLSMEIRLKRTTSGAKWRLPLPLKFRNLNFFRFSFTTAGLVRGLGSLQLELEIDTLAGSEDDDGDGGERRGEEREDRGKIVTRGEEHAVKGE